MQEKMKEDWLMQYFEFVPPSCYVYLSPESYTSLPRGSLWYFTLPRPHIELFATLILKNTLSWASLRAGLALLLKTGADTKY